MNGKILRKKIVKACFVLGMVALFGETTKANELEEVNNITTLPIIEEVVVGENSNLKEEVVDKNEETEVKHDFDNVGDKDGNISNIPELPTLPPINDEVEVIPPTEILPPIDNGHTIPPIEVLPPHEEEEVVPPVEILPPHEEEEIIPPMEILPPHEEEEIIPPVVEEEVEVEDEILGWLPPVISEKEDTNLLPYLMAGANTAANINNDLNVNILISYSIMFIVSLFALFILLVFGIKYFKENYIFKK